MDANSVNLVSRFLKPFINVVRNAATKMIDADAFRAELDRVQGGGWGWLLRIPMGVRIALCWLMFDL
jgi:hypothetical protein